MHSGFLASRCDDCLISDGDIVPPVLMGRYFQKRESNCFITKSHDVTINRHINLRPQSSATLASTFTAGGPGVAGGGYQMGKGRWVTTPQGPQISTLKVRPVRDVRVK